FRLHRPRRISKWHGSSSRSSGGTIRSYSIRRSPVKEKSRTEVSEIREILSRFWDQLIAREHGPLAFRLILQPIMATILAMRDGLKDTRAGRPLYTWTILSDSAHRGAFLREGVKRVSRVIVFALLMDGIYQFVVLGRFYPGEALTIALVVAVLPYLLIRGPVTRIARRWSSRGAAYDKVH